MISLFEFGIRLRKLRNKYKMTQTALGERIGKSKPVISNYENGLKFPSLDTAIDLASIFNVSLDYLAGLDKAEMISVEKLTESQRNLVQTIVYELSDKSKIQNGLTPRQQEILGELMNEFSKKHR